MTADTSALKSRIIASSTPGSKISISVPRADISAEEMSSLGKISLKYFLYPENKTDVNIFLQLPELRQLNYEPLDLFSKLIWPLRQQRSSWSGFMQMFEDGTTAYPGKSHITFMPMLDLNPSAMSCIYTTLNFVCDQAFRYNKTPVLTFDQPLFQKATFIVDSQEPSSPIKQLVLRLGAFHTEMSFLGCIGYLMAGSGLQETLETVYASNAVTHMMTGKAIQRALRGHFLVDNALHVLLLENILQVQMWEKEAPDQVQTEHFEPEGCNNMPEIDAMLPLVSFTNNAGSGTDMTKENEDNQEDVLKLALLYDDLRNKKTTVTSIRQCEPLEKLTKIILEGRKKFILNRTAILWIQYMDMVAILQQFIRAERTGDWRQHLAALQQMLPYFASSGHNLYLKSAYIYLQNMLRLEHTHPDVYSAFLTGGHVIRRSERLWAGLSADLVIEQVLMRSLKTTGGLTRGRGMSDQQRSLWLLSMSVCLEMNNAMQEVSQTTFQTSDQHKETSKSRSTKDQKDMNAIMAFLKDRNPFNEADVSLRNVETGVTAEMNVNADRAREIGETIVKEMVGKLSETYTFKRSLKSITLHDSSRVKVSGDCIHIDTQLLFQRLTTAANKYVEDVSEIFRYEVCSNPPSLFNNSGLLREAQKATLADAIWKMGDCSHGQPSETYTSELTGHSDTWYVVDGGSLLQKIPWNKGSTFGEICSSYLQYLQRKYAKVTVVFDGYSSEPSTKDVAHYRRSKGAVGTMVNFSFDTPFRSKKDIFLRHQVNKQNFIFMLGECLMGNGITVHHSAGDVDCLIVKTAIEKARDCNVVLVGEDTDLLVLLCHHYALGLKTITFKSDSRKASNTKTWDICKTKILLGEDLCLCFPLLHALTGCDTTSRMFGIGKAAAVKLFQKNVEFRAVCRAFINSAAPADVIKLGESLITTMYDGSCSENLDTLRYKKFAAKVITSSSYVQVHSLPPTAAAAAYHSLRIYYQTRIWMGNDNLNPLDYDWQDITSSCSRKTPANNSL